MNGMGRRITLALFVLAAACLWAASPALADECHPVRGEINLADLTITGNFGLVGTVAFVADSVGTPPATAPATASVFSGLLTITTDSGVIELRETGMFSSRTGNPEGPVLSSWGDFLSGTGRYADLTHGELFFFGSRVDGVLLLDVAGELCHD